MPLTSTSVKSSIRFFLRFRLINLHTKTGIKPDNQFEAVIFSVQYASNIPLSQDFCPLGIVPDQPCYFIWQKIRLCLAGVKSHLQGCPSVPLCYCNTQVRACTQIRTRLYELWCAKYPECLSAGVWTLLSFLEAGHRARSQIHEL